MCGPCAERRLQIELVKQPENKGKMFLSLLSNDRYRSMSLLSEKEGQLYICATALLQDIKILSLFGILKSIIYCTVFRSRILNSSENMVAGIPVDIVLNGYSAAELRLDSRDESVGEVKARNDYWVEREFKSGKGYCDYIFIPKKTGNPAIILELKYGKSCEEAISQIKEKQHMQKIKSCKEILLVGINYDEKKHHSCKIEKYITE